MFAKIMAFFLAIYTALLSFFGLGTHIKKPDVSDDAFIPVLRFAASSDSHVKTLGDKGCKRIAKMINTGYAVAETDKNYDKLDAVVLTGDMTDKGTKDMFNSMYASVQSAVKDGTEFIGVVAKSHDCNSMGRDALDYYTQLTGLGTDRHEIINGFHFISISAGHDGSVHYTAQQIAWLDVQLAAAAAADPAKPIFVFQHEHIYDTVFGSYPEDGWGDKYFIDVLSKYPQVIDISGHSHYPANDPRAIWQDSFTAINDGGLAYYEFTFEGQRAYHPDGNGDMAQFLLIEVDAKNNVKVRVYDLTAEKFVWEFFIDNVSDPVKTKYSQSARKAAAKAPVFDAAPVHTTSAGKDVFTVSPAKAGEGDIVFLYRFTVTDKNGAAVDSQTVLSDYYYTTSPADVIFKTDALKKGGEYTVTILAEDAWGLQSKPLVLTLSK